MMSFNRFSAALIAIGATAALAACGGGGAGSSTVPSTSTNGEPSSAPTVVPTATPAASPTASPTAPPTPAITVAANSATILAYDGSTNGTDDTWQKNGITVAGDPADGDTAQGGTGSNTIDGQFSCGIGTEQMVTPNSYHVHAFLGLYVNGTSYAIPDGIGMQNPQENASPILTFACAYNLHTHWSSGVIHVEDPAITGNGASPPWSTIAPPAKYNLQALFDIWGQPISSSGVAGLSGPVTIYAGTPCPNNADTCTTPKKTTNGDDLVTSYVSEGASSGILLSHHKAIWIVVGAMPASGLPQVEFGLAE